jgi:hypothetical protein
MKADAPLSEWKQYRHLFERLEIPAKTTLLKEGQIAHHTYFLEKGCMRIWFNNAGKDITLNFFMEGEGVSIGRAKFQVEPYRYQPVTRVPTITPAPWRHSFK